MYVRYPLSLRNVEDLLFERGSTYATRRFRSGGTGSVRCSRLTFVPVDQPDAWLSPLEVAPRLDVRPCERQTVYLWRAVDHEGDVLESYVTRTRDLQKFASIHASRHNHFAQERHLLDRITFKERRSAALAEWQTLAA